MSTNFAVISNGAVRNTAAATLGGSGNANQIPALNGNGQFDATMLPTGVGPDVFTAPAFEALSVGNLVAIYSNAGVVNVRKADASAGYQAVGYVTSAVASAGIATVFKYGTISGLTGLTIGGAVYLSTTGALTQTAPSTVGYLCQQVGIASSATTVEFNPLQPLYL